jgi:LysM repeat protein
MSNDTLGGIAARYGLNAGFLAHINNLSNPDLLQVGQVLQLVEPKTDPLAEAIKVLQGAGIINSPDYWLQNARPGALAEGEYVGYLLLNTAAKLRR